MASKKHKNNNCREVTAAELIRLFVSALGQHSRHFQWHLDRYGAIRAQHPNCPHEFDVITAVHYSESGLYRPIAETHDVAEVLDIAEVSQRIVAAADLIKDQPKDRIEQGLREKLLAAVQLKELERFDNGR